jgi:glycosyltransferase involved in cell wall biosynthesis
MEKADLIIAVSNFTKEKVMKYYGINSEKIVVIHNAVEEFP